MADAARARPRREGGAGWPQAFALVAVHHHEGRVGVSGGFVTTNAHELGRVSGSALRHQRQPAPVVHGGGNPGQSEEGVS